MGTSDEVIKTKIDDTIIKLAQPSSGTCPSHQPLCEGVGLLLQIEKAKLAGEMQPGENSITVGNVTLKGSVAIIGALVLYCLLKTHGMV